MSSARKRNLEFDLSKEQVRQLVVQSCRYCGKPPSQTVKAGALAYNGGFTYNGIDRISSNLGYVEDNVVPCCKQCNYAKNILGVDEFKAWITQAYRYFVEGQIE